MKKNILVIGAGSGIGRALLELLNTLPNLRVVGVSRRGVPYHKTQVVEAGTNYKCDLTNEKEIHSFFEYYHNSFKEIHAIYLCQGDGLFGNISSLSKDSLEKHFSLNIISSFLVLQKFYPLLRSSKENPFVCFLSSTAGKIGFPESTAYCASKHAIAGLAKSLREEWKKDKIRIFTVYPGAVSTEIWDKRQGFDQKDMISPEEFAEYLKSFLQLPITINLDESYVLPIKGIL